MEYRHAVKHDLDQVRVEQQILALETSDASHYLWQPTLNILVVVALNYVCLKFRQWSRP